MADHLWQAAAEDEAAMLTLADKIAAQLMPGAVVFLQGDLGMGKTTLCRGMIQALGHAGHVKSPTYTLVEPYQLGGRRVFHFDLYRLGDPDELEYIGLRDYFDGGGICLVEWPERGAGMLPTPDLVISIAAAAEGRRVALEGITEVGRAILSGLS